MIKRSSILFLLSFCVIIQAADPRLAGFEPHHKSPLDQTNLEHITGKDKNKASKEDAQQAPTAEEQMALMHLALNLMAQNQELTEENKALIEKNKQLLNGADSVLKQEIEQHKQDKKDLFWILLGSTATAGAAGAAIPSIVSKAIEDSKNPNGILWTSIIPDFINRLIKEQELNKTITQTTVQGVHLEVNTQQLIEALYRTLNPAVPLWYNKAKHYRMLNDEITQLAQQNPSENFNQVARVATRAIDNMPSLSKEDFARLFLKNFAITLLNRGVRLTDNKILLEAPGNKAIILRKNQVKEAVCETGTKIINDLYEKRPTSIGGFSNQCAVSVGSQVGYNALVQFVHLIAEKTNTNINALNFFLPKDCQPKDIFSFYTKLLIRWGISTGILTTTGYAASVAKSAAIWAVMHMGPVLMPIL